MQKAVAKTIAGFLNFEGGTLLVGVADDGTVVGIEHDLRTLQRQDLDGFEQALRQTISDLLGPEFNQLVRTGYEQLNGHSAARVTVDPSPHPVYLREGGKTEFYVRAGNTTRPLELASALDYIQMHWNG